MIVGSAIALVALLAALLPARDPGPAATRRRRAPRGARRAPAGPAGLSGRAGGGLNRCRSYSGSLQTRLRHGGVIANSVLGSAAAIGSRGTRLIALARGPAEGAVVGLARVAGVAAAGDVIAVALGAPRRAVGDPGVREPVRRAADVVVAVVRARPSPRRRPGRGGAARTPSRRGESRRRRRSSCRCRGSRPSTGGRASRRARPSSRTASAVAVPRNRGSRPRGRTGSPARPRTSCRPRPPPGRASTGPRGSCGSRPAAPHPGLVDEVRGVARRSSWRASRLGGDERRCARPPRSRRRGRSRTPGREPIARPARRPGARSRRAPRARRPAAPPGPAARPTRPCPGRFVADGHASTLGGRERAVALRMRRVGAAIESIQSRRGRPARPDHRTGKERRGWRFYVVATAGRPAADPGRPEPPAGRPRLPLHPHADAADRRPGDRGRPRRADRLGAAALRRSRRAERERDEKRD